MHEPLHDEDLQAIADSIVSRMGTLPRSLRDMLRVNTTQMMSLHYVARDSLIAPQIRYEFTEAGVYIRWEHPNGTVLAQQFLTWRGE